MTSMPLRIDGNLIKEARASGEIFHRSIAQQLEHWATLGKALEAVLNLSSVEKLKKGKDSVNVDDLLAKANSSAGKKRTLALLAKKKGPLYGNKPGQPEILLQYRADGSKVAGQIVKGVPVSQWLRAPAILSLSAAVWVLAGTWLLHFRALTGFPIFSFLLIGAFAFSFINDNHHIRLDKEVPLASASGETVRQAFDDWLKQASHVPPSVGPRQMRPVFIVATEGGGIRAAYWTASVLGSLQQPSEAELKKYPGASSFSGATFAISGVSGGSVGGAVFDALLSPETGWTEVRRPRLRSGVRHVASTG